MQYEVEKVAVPEQALAVLGGRGRMAEIGDRMRRLRRTLTDAGMASPGPWIGRFYEDTQTGDELDYEVCLPIEAPDGVVPDRIGDAAGEIVPAHHALSTRHVGSRDEMDDAVSALHEAMDALGYRPAGPLTEVYVAGAAEGLEPSAFVTELRLPYAR
jgi:effector-binding domain-containing protein